ncbi:MAG: Lrp/AsnC family transcriptional regulator [Candidatus ainarchaeum sp.]|nr:Lrp/AsnC family transcriptional regulator [Candidatus ainarchaeum sp.]
MKTDHMSDEISSEIINELKKNSRISYRKLASKLGVSTVTVIDRIKKLEKEKIITGYSVITDPIKFGYEFMGIVQITISRGSLLETQKKISSFSGVIGVYDVTGQYDSFVIVMCKNRGEFSNLIKKILHLPNVERTNTSVVLNVLKDPSHSLL